MQEMMGDEQIRYEQIKNVDIDKDTQMIEISLRKLNEKADQMVDLQKDKTIKDFQKIKMPK